jgi:hypothetical protein
MARRPLRQGRPPGRMIIDVIEIAYYDGYECSVANAYARRHGLRLLYVALEPCDMRKSFNTLAALVRNHLGLDPLCGAAFLFTNKSRRLIKILYFGGTGYT